jgi:soluble lytic murein transglycosylase-like protein
VRPIFDIWLFWQQWLEATAALLHVAPQPTMTPPKAAYYAACMVQAEQTYGIPWSQVAAIIQHESQWRETLVSATNDYGLGQHHCPSFFCSREPSPLAKAALFDPCMNIQLTAEELTRKRKRCRKCGNYVKLYNPGNPTYARQIARWEAKFKQAGRAGHPLRAAMSPPASPPAPVAQPARASSVARLTE